MFKKLNYGYSNIKKINIRSNHEIYKKSNYFNLSNNIIVNPNKIIIMQGEELNYKTALGLILCDDSSMQTSSNINKKKISDSGTIDVSLNLFGKIPLKHNFSFVF